MNRNKLPHLLGSKIVGHEVAAEAVAKATSPHLGSLALGIADRNGEKLKGAPVAVVTTDADASDDAELNGIAPVAPLTVVDSPEVLAAAEKLDTKKKK